VDELIQEKVKNAKIKEYEIVIENDEYLEFEKNFFIRNSIKKNEIESLLKENNVSYQELKDFLINEISWGKLVRGLFVRLTSVSEMEVDEIISKNPSITEEQAQNLVIQRQLDLQSSKLLRDIMSEATIEYK
jgi:hypothetical protein